MKPRLPILLLTALAAAPALAGDWYRWRGPEQNGTCRETGLPDSWDPEDPKTYLWRIPVGGMSSPIVMNGKLYTITRVGEEASAADLVPGLKTQEAVICIDAGTGKTIWQHNENLFQTRVPFHRLGWANPSADPATGRIYVLGVQCTMQCLEGDSGKLVWRRQLTEEFGMISTFGGRTNTPVVDGDQVIISGVTFGWGDHARGQYRLLAFDKATGRLNWANNTGGLPVDAPFNTPVIAVVNGVRLVICAAGDGGVHAFKVRTGEKVWSFVASRRGMNASVVVEGNRVYISQGEENVDSTTMGRVCCLDISGAQPKELWRVDGIEAGYASPTLKDGKLYVMENKARLVCLNADSGDKLWQQKLGTIGKASLVWADGKLYIPEANGKFYILKPGEKKCEILSRTDLPDKSGREYSVFGSIAISNGRIYLQCANQMYCIGPKEAKVTPTFVPEMPAESNDGAAAFVQVVPADVLLRPGEKVQFEFKVLNAAGRPVPLAASAKPQWSVGQLTLALPSGEKRQIGNLKGEVSDGGEFTAAGGPPQGGAVAVKIAGLTGHARVRVMAPLPWKFDFEANPEGAPPLVSIGAGGKFEVRKLPDGNKALVKFTKLADDDKPDGKDDPRYNPLYDQAWTYFGSSAMSEYTVEADCRAAGHEIEVAGKKQLQMPDMGIVNSRYLLVMHGNHQKLAINTWPATLPYSLNKTIPFKWEPKVWYHLKLTVRQVGDKAVIKGKVWKKGEAEPAAWTVELEDQLPNRTGAPAVFAFSYSGNAVYYDNLLVTANGKE